MLFSCAFSWGGQIVGVFTQLALAVNLSTKWSAHITCDINKIATSLYQHSNSVIRSHKPNSTLLIYAALSAAGYLKILYLACTVLYCWMCVKPSKKEDKEHNRNFHGMHEPNIKHSQGFLYWLLYLDYHLPFIYSLIQDTHLFNLDGPKMVDQEWQMRFLWVVTGVWILKKEGWRMLLKFTRALQNRIRNPKSNDT